MHINQLLTEIGAHMMNEENVTKLVHRWRNPGSKMDIDDATQMVSFRPTYDVRNKEELLKKLKEFHDSGLGGMSVDKLKESETKTFKVDVLVDELEKNGLVLVCRKTVRSQRITPDRVVYYRDRGPESEIDKEFVDLWTEVANKHHSEDVPKYLERKSKPVFQKAKIKVTGKKRKRKRNANP